MRERYNHTTIYLNVVFILFLCIENKFVLKFTELFIIVLLTWIKIFEQQYLIFYN